MIDVTRFGDAFVEKRCARCGTVVRWKRCEACGKAIDSTEEFIQP